MYAIKAPHFVHGVNVKEIVNDFEISISFDDSCGRLSQLSRSNIRIFKGEEDVTNQFSDEMVIVGNIENLIKVYAWCNAQVAEVKNV